jgi:membrane peptidoglycan carboxypeptidase
VHTDLFTIDRKVPWYVPDDPLISVEKMVLILEDRRVFWHRGFDLKSAIREAARAIAVQPHGGASTIDMQLVRTATGYRQRTIGRKLYEILLAMLIQYRYNKIQILRSYMDCAYFGSHLYGVQTVCSRIYKKRPDELSLDEAAQVAAMLVYPRPRNPSPQWQLKLIRRANYARSLYPQFEKSFDKLPRWEMF